MNFATLSVEDAIPQEGEFEIISGGKTYAVVRHPRMIDGWMAVTPPTSLRDCGMKKFAKRSSAICQVLKAIAAQSHSSQLGNSK